jgi:hypothetical protein
MNSARIVTPYFCKINFSIIPPSINRSAKWLFCEVVWLKLSMHFSSASCVLFTPFIFTILDLITIIIQYLSKYCQHIFSAFLCGKKWKHVLVKALILVAQSAVYIYILMKQLCYIISTCSIFPSFAMSS